MKTLTGLLLASVSVAHACSDVQLNFTNPNTVMSARTMDFDVDLQSVLEVIPRNTTFQEPPVCSCPSCPNYKWQSKYGFLAFNMFKLNIAADALNEKGLSAAWLYLEDSTEYPTPDASPTAKPIVTSIPSYLLGNFATVDEVKEGLKSIQMAEIDDRVQFVPSVFPVNPEVGRLPLHVAVHDAQGKSLVIEFLKGQAVVLDNPNGVLTNEPALTDQLKALKNATTSGVSNGVSYTPMARFQRLSLINSLLVAAGYESYSPNASYLVGSETQSAVSASLHLMNTVVLPAEEANQWTLVRDHKAPAIYFQSTLNQQLRRLQLADFDLSNSTSRQYIPVYEPASAWFEDAAAVFKNQSQVKKSRPAQTVWASHLLYWQRLGLWRDDDSRNQFVQALFSLRVRHTPAAVWGFVDQRSVDVDAVDDVHAAIMVVWQQQVLGGMQRIWQWRHGVDDDDEPWSAAVAASAFRSSQVSAIHKAAQGARKRSSAIIGSICRGLLRVLTAAQPAMQTPVARVGRFLLFFDGGSRGNPGPGGAGAVVVHVDAFGSDARIVWSAAMSLANKKTTNNQAEYVGLVQGLKAAKTNQWKPLKVIGDSAMIITQLRDSRVPKHPRLRRYYARARILADTVGVAHWSHHVRAFNKMADAAANLAMDGRHSLQAFHPTARPEWAVLHEHLLGDVNQWRAYTHPGSSSIG